MNRGKVCAAHKPNDDKKFQPNQKKVVCHWQGIAKVTATLFFAMANAGQRA
jgi:hypothetical protein